MFSSLNLRKLNKFFKKISKPAKHGRKIGKGLASIGGVKNDKTTDINVAIGQGIGMIAVPTVVFIISSLMKRLSKHKRKLFAMAATAGLTVSRYVGDLAAYGNMTNLSSSFNGMLGIITGLVVTTGLFLIAPWIYRKINQFRARRAQQPIQEKKLFTKSLYARLNSGLEFGATIGASIGASLEFAIPGWGFLAAAIGAVVGAPIGALTFTLAPKLMARYMARKTAHPHQKRKSVVNPNLMNFKSGVGIGATTGSMLGIIIGSVLLPGVGTVLGGIIGAGMGGVFLGALTALAPSVINLFNHQRLAESKLKKFGDYLYSAMTCIKTFTPIGSALGALVGTIIFPGIGTLVGIAIGGLAACMIGVATPKISASFENRAAKTSVTGAAAIGEKSANKSISFTQLLNRTKAIISFAAAIGGMIGGVAGTFLMPGVGSALGAAVGAGIAAGLAIACVIILPKIFRHFKNENAKKSQQENLISMEEINPKPEMELEPLPAILPNAKPKPEKVLSSHQRIKKSLIDKPVRLTTIIPIPPRSRKPKRQAPITTDENSGYLNLNYFAAKEPASTVKPRLAVKFGR